MKSHAHQVILVNGHLVGFPWCPSMNGPAMSRAKVQAMRFLQAPWGLGARERMGSRDPLALPSGYVKIAIENGHL